MQSATIYCDSCGAANRQGAKFCFSCGGQLHQEPEEDNQPALPAGLLHGRYRLLKQLGQGGFGAVYIAEDTEVGNRKVAVKEMSQKGLAAQEVTEAVEAFKHEAHLLGGLMHPNLPRIYDHFSEESRWYLVMDFIEGETLEERLNRASGQPLSLLEGLDIGIKLCTVLDYLHNRQPPIIFRDLKPSNIMLTADGNLYLIDFGIARHFKPGQAKDTVAFGSPGYAAPEQYGRAQTTPRSDIYSLGAILHQLLSGSDPSLTPFRFAPLPAGDIPARLNDLVMSMVEVDDSKRPASMAEVRQTLQDIILHPDQDVEHVVVQTPRTPDILVWSKLICTYRGHSNDISALSWSPDGKRIVSATIGGIAKVWDADRGDPLCTYALHTDHILGLSWSPDGTQIASAGKDGAVHIWEAATGSQIKVYADSKTRMPESWIYSVAWSPDGRYVAAGGRDKAVYVWNIDTGVVATVYQRHHDYVYAVAWSPDGQYIASASADKTVRVWDVKTGYTSQVYREHNDFVYALAWSPDGEYVISAGEDKSVQVWHVRTGSDLYLYRSSEAVRFALAWPMDGLRSAYASYDSRVSIWDDARKQVKEVYQSSAPHIYTLAWSPDGRYIASGGNNKDVEVWQVM